MNNHLVTSLCVLCAILSAIQGASAQGPLTPPGPPGPTMLTLNQVEPRTPITNLPYNITSSGSYYLTTNLTCAACTNGQNGISTDASVENVTIDLGGFTLFGVSGSADGITAGTGHNNVIRNGTVRGWGNTGVFGANASNCRFESLQVFGNANVGLHTGVGSVVVNCGAYSNAVAGIQLAGGEMSHCVAVGNGTGILASAACVVVDCASYGNLGDGITVGVGTSVRGCAACLNGNNGVTAANSCAVIGCTVNTNGNIGISLADNCTAKDCIVSGTGINGYGMFVGNNCAIKDCNVSGNAATGIYVNGNNCQITGNNCSGNNHGITLAIGAGQNLVDGNIVAHNSYGIYPISANVTNCITRNFAPGNSDGNYNNTSGNNDYAPIQTPNSSTNPWANF